LTAVPPETRHGDDAASRVPQGAREDGREIELSLRDPDRFGVIFDRYFTEIHGYVARRVGTDAADDIAAETFLTDPQGYANGFDFDITAGPGKLTGFMTSTGAEPFIVGSRTLSEAQLQALPPDPARLKALILTGYDASASGESADAYLFQATPVVLTMPVTPAVRSALYQMLATLPGVRSLGQVRDAGGQLGTAVAITGSYSHCGGDSRNVPGGSEVYWTFSSCVVQQRLVIDPETGLPFAQELRYLKLPAGQTWSAPDGLLSYELFDTARWTNATPPGK
jgi:hypothetical protein